jgi:hypothetical protein
MPAVECIARVSLSLRASAVVEGALQPVHREEPLAQIVAPRLAGIAFRAGHDEAAHHAIADRQAIGTGIRVARIVEVVGVAGSGSAAVIGEARSGWCS